MSVRRAVFIITFVAPLSFPEPSEKENQTPLLRSAPSSRWFRSTGSLVPVPCERVSRSLSSQSSIAAHHCRPSFSVITLDLESQKFAHTINVGSPAPYLRENWLRFEWLAWESFSLFCLFQPRLQVIKRLFA